MPLLLSPAAQYDVVLSFYKYMCVIYKHSPTPVQQTNKHRWHFFQLYWYVLSDEWIVSQRSSKCLTCPHCSCYLDCFRAFTDRVVLRCPFCQMVSFLYLYSVNFHENTAFQLTLHLLDYVISIFNSAWLWHLSLTQAVYRLTYSTKISHFYSFNKE